MVKKGLPQTAAAVAAAMLLVAGCGSSGGSKTKTGTAGSSSTTITTTSSSATSDAKYNITGVYENTEDPYWVTYVCGAMTEAKKLGVNLKVYSQPTQDEGKLATTLDTALLRKPQGLLFNPVDVSPWLTKMMAVMNSGIPVVSSQADLAGRQVGYTFSQQSGGVGASRAVNILKNENGEAVKLVGLASASWEDERLNPVVNSLKAGAPNLKWIGPQIDGFDVNKGTQLLSGVIAAHPNLKLILAVAGPEGQAAAAAVKQAHMAGRIHVIAFDAVPAEVDALRSGVIDFLLAQPASALGANQVKLVVDWLKAHQGASGPVASAKTSFLPALGVITRDNVDSPAIKPYVYKSSC